MSTERDYNADPYGTMKDGAIGEELSDDARIEKVMEAIGGTPVKSKIVRDVADMLFNMARMFLGTGGTNKLWWPELCLIGLVPVNIVQVQNPQHKGKLTRYALEDGEPVGDHFHREPYMVRIRGKWVSDGGLQHVYYHALRIIHEKKLLVPYLSNMALRKNMMVTQLSPVHKQGEANAFTFDVTLQQVTFGKAGEAEPWEPSEDPATGETPEGGASNEGGSGEGSGNGTGNDSSLLASLWDWLTGRTRGDSGETEETAE